MDENEEEKLENLTKYTLNIPYSLNKLDDKEFLTTLIRYSGNKFSMLPLMVDVLDIKDILKLLFVFSGQTIEIPKQSVLETSLRDLDIYFTLKENKYTNENIYKLSMSYNITEQAVKTIFLKVQEKLNKD